MTAGPAGMPPPDVFRRWLSALQKRDPELHAELTARLEERERLRSMQPEGVSRESAVPEPDVVLETIVREGRPALLVREHRITGLDTAVDRASEAIMSRLRTAAATVEPLIPLVGRIDVANHAAGLPFVGTGWLIDRDVVVTNRHVAELISRGDGAKFVFRPGRFGDPVQVSIDFRHELNVSATDAVPVQRIIWIETDPRKADFALLQVRRRTDGTVPDRIELADSDADPDTDIVVIGYPARAPAHIIPDQAWMDRIYGGTYDVKRVAPGMAGGPSRGWATHDATTLGGNSGSVVVDMTKGKAVALHFAGQYMIENYCVPASTLRQYLKDAPWTHGPRRDERAEPPKPVAPPQSPTTRDVSISAGGVTITVPLHIHVSMGTPTVGPPAGEDGGRQDASAGQKARQTKEESVKVLDAARSLSREMAGDGVLAVRHGYLLDGTGLSDTPCLVVAAHPDRIEEVRARAPRDYQGFPVDVRPASLRDQIGDVEEIATEAAMRIAYNDEDRTGKGFSFNWVEEDMDVVTHVGPERISFRTADE
jgi:V8-like Glu-specific endopeptidase